VKGALGIELNLHLVSNNKLAGNFEQAGNRAPATFTPAVVIRIFTRSMRQPAKKNGDSLMT
jgi:hypothetical protein